MQIFKAIPFARFARRAGISDTDLCGAVQRAESGLIAANLGGGVIEQRVRGRARETLADFARLLSLGLG